jgi:hopanoid-associated phosphorylase
LRIASRLQAVLGAGLDAWPAGGGLSWADAAPDGPWAGILSFGCAGALDPALAPGDCVVATGVVSTAGGFDADPAWTRALVARLPDARAGLVAGRDLPLAAAADKRRLWLTTGACVADMESHAAARVAQRLGLPFAACRVVLDPAWRNLPSCALAGLGPNGSADWLPLLRALAGEPRELGDLCALAREAWVARRALRRVRAALGMSLGLLPG